MHDCTNSADYNESVLCLFVFRVKKKENNALPEFFKMFSIVQMMFIKEVNLIQCEFSMIHSPVERRNRVAQFIRHIKI